MIQTDKKIGKFIQGQPFHSIVQTILKSNSFKQTIYLNFSQCLIKVSSNSIQLMEMLARYYSDFLMAPASWVDVEILLLNSAPIDFGMEFSIKQPDPGKKKIKEEYIDFTDGRIVRKRLTEMEFLFDASLNLGVGPCLANVNQVVNFINNRYIQWRLNKGAILLHAAAVHWKSRGAALCGFSGMGKSTLALHLMSAGTVFVSNDRLMVQEDDKGLKMYGVAKWPRINPGTVLNNPDLTQVIPATDRRVLSKLNPEELWNLERKYDVDIGGVYGKKRFDLSARMNVLFILNWKRNAEPFRLKKIRLKNRPDLWPAFMKDVGLFFLPTHPNYFSQYATPEAYLTHLNRIESYELVGGVNFKKAAKECVGILKNSPTT